MTATKEYRSREAAAEPSRVFVATVIDSCKMYFLLNCSMLQQQICKQTETFLHLSCQQNYLSAYTAKIV